MAARGLNESTTTNDTASTPHGHYHPDLEHNHQMMNHHNSEDQSEAHTGSLSSDQSRYLDNLARGRAAKFFVNGEVFEPAKRVVYNPKQFKDFGHYLDHLTDKLAPKFGAVRKICTPHHGHRIRELRDLQENGVYVVAGKEKFMPYRYEQIPSNTNRKVLPPSVHAEPMFVSRQYVTSGRIKKCETHSIIIKVWPNGGDLKGPRRVLLTPRVRPFTLDNVLTSVNEILKEDLLGTVERLHFLTGVQVSDIDQISHNGQYVACKKKEKFKRTQYNEHGIRNLSTSPRLQRKLLAPLFPRTSYSVNHFSPDQSNESTQSSVKSNSQRLRALGDDGTHPVRPVKYTSPDRAHLSDQERVNRSINQTRSGQDKHIKPGHAAATEHQNGRPINNFNAHKTNRDTKPSKPPESRQPKKRQDSNERLHELDHAATKIQAAYRGHQTRSDLKSPKQPTEEKPQRHYSEDELLEADSALTKIQSAYRGYLARKENKKQPSSTVGDNHNQNQESRKSTEEEFDQAATKIQAAYRGHQARKNYRPNTNQQVNEVDDDQKVKAATKIQAGFRGYLDRKSRGYKEKKEREEAATKIQAGFRGYNTRKQINPQNENMDEKDKAAAKIQAGIRGYKARKQLSTSKVAATKIQAGIRGYLTRKDLSNKTAAATKIQAGYRGYATRKQLTRQSYSYDELARKNMAALTIQSHYRGYQTRKELGNRQNTVQEESYWP